MARPSLTRTHRILLGVVAAGACLISGIGFAGSYNAVRMLAVQKGFGVFSYAFPIGVDVGIVVLLSLDLVLTWLRIPFPLLRQTAWVLTGATIAFNAAASWGDPLGMGMHAVIPVLFIVVVEASRHAVGRIAAITADRHMESVRMMRWVLSPIATFRLWRRMKLWELRSYDETIRLEQNRLVYRAQLRFRYGRGWRRAAPFEALLPLKLAKYGVPLDPAVLDHLDGPAQVGGTVSVAKPEAGQATVVGQTLVPALSAAVAVPVLGKLAAMRLRDAQDPDQAAQPAPAGSSELNVWSPREAPGQGDEGRLPGQASPWFKSPRPDRPAAQGERRLVQGVPSQGAPSPAARRQPVSVRPEGEPTGIGPRQGRPNVGPAPKPTAEQLQLHDARPTDDLPAGRPEPGPHPGMRAGMAQLDVNACFEALTTFMDTYDQQPDPHRLADYLTREWGMAGSRPDGSVNPKDLERIWPELEKRYVASGRQ